MKKRIPLLEFTNFNIVDSNKNSNDIDVFYKNISSNLQEIIDESFNLPDPTILSPIGYFYCNENKDLILIYNLLQIFSIKDYMTRDFLIAFKIAFGVCRSLTIYDKFINFKLSLILIDLQQEPRLLPFFNVKINDNTDKNKFKRIYK